jgi:hypothetical protein
MQSKGFTLAELLVSIVFLGIFGAGLFALFGKMSVDPDAAVMRAAKAMTPSPIVADGGFAWYGCSKGDTFRFEVKDSSGASVGYVCQGWSIIPGLERGATPRFN